MALAIQQPRVSLIGGKELPKASGEGVRLPDISNAFTGLANRLSAEADRNKQIDDKIAGQSQMEEFIAANPGKDPLGLYTKPPVVNGTPEFRLSALDSLEQNAVAKISSVANARFAEIQTSIEDDTPKKLAKMRAYADGVISQIAPEFRTRARGYFSTEIQQRENYLINDDYRRHQQAMFDGVQRRITDNTNLAISAASAGAPYQRHTQEAYKAIDEQLHLGLIDQTTADANKTALGTLVVAAGTQELISKEAFNGNVTVQNLADFAVSLDTGGDVELVITQAYEPGFAQHDQFDTGQKDNAPKASEKKFSSAKMRETLGSELSTTVSTDLKQLAEHLGQVDRANEKRRQLFDFGNAQGAGSTQQVPPALKSVLDEVTVEMISGKAFDSSEGVAMLILNTRRFKFMPPSLTQELRNRLLGTPEQARQAVEIWNAISTAQDGDVDVGRLVSESMPADDVSALEGAKLLMQDVSDPEAYRKAIVRLQEKGNTVEYWKKEFNAAKEEGDAGFEASLRARYYGEYGTTTIDPEFAGEFERAYRNTMSLTSDPDPLKAFNATFDRMKTRWKKDPIYTEGFERHPGFENPPGYKFGPMGQLFQNKNQWANDFLVEQVGFYLADNQLWLGDPDVKNQLEQVLGPNVSGNPLGNGLTLQAVPGTSGEGTQFYVNLRMPDLTDTRLEVIDKSGRHVPLIVDPGIVLANVKSRQAAAAALEEMKTSQRIDAQSQIYKEYSRTATGLDAVQRVLSLDFMRPMLGMDDIEFERWFATRPDDFQKKYLADERARTDAYKKRQLQLQQQIIKLPEGMKVSPEILLTPKASGNNVVLGAIEQIETILPDGTGGQFMANVAMAESAGGTAEGTYRANGDRGIWQVNDGPQGAFLEVQRRARIVGDPVQVAAEKLKAIGVDVANASPSDLDKPLVNAAFARLYFTRLPGQIPDDVEGQAELWKSAYNTEAGAGTVGHFIAQAGKLVVTPAYASTGVEAGGPGMVTDMAGNAFPANFQATQPITQTSVQRLSGAFGKPLRITPHGGTQADRRRSTSQHRRGTAVDIYVADYTDAEKTQLIALAIKMGFRGIGGYGAGDGVGTIHIDLRAGGRHNGLGLWWRHKPGVDSDWQGGARWFVDGVNQGMAMRGQNRA